MKTAIHDGWRVTTVEMSCRRRDGPTLVKINGVESKFLTKLLVRIAGLRKEVSIETTPRVQLFDSVHAASAVSALIGCQTKTAVVGYVDTDGSLFGALETVLLARHLVRSGLKVVVPAYLEDMCCSHGIPVVGAEDVLSAALSVEALEPPPPLDQPPLLGIGRTDGTTALSETTVKLLSVAAAEKLKTLVVPRSGSPMVLWCLESICSCVASDVDILAAIHQFTRRAVRPQPVLLLDSDCHDFFLLGTSTWPGSLAMAYDGLVVCRAPLFRKKGGDIIKAHRTGQTPHGWPTRFALFVVSDRKEDKRAFDLVVNEAKGGATFAKPLTAPSVGAKLTKGAENLLKEHTRVVKVVSLGLAKLDGKPSASVDHVREATRLLKDNGTRTDR